MSICIDRNHNVIVNQAGRSHRTGWVVLTVVKDLTHLQPIGRCLSRGNGYYKGGVHKTEAWGPIVRFDGDLTTEMFVALTGWLPEA